MAKKPKPAKPKDAPAAPPARKPPVMIPRMPRGSIYNGWAV
jgi:hypothetical protein